MKTMRAQDLVEHINEILHMIKEEGEPVEVTDDGEIIARLVPVNNSSPQHAIKQNNAGFLDMLNRHAEEIGKHRGVGSVDAVQIVREGRREL